MIRRPPRSTLFPTRRSSDLESGKESHDDERKPTKEKRTCKAGQVGQHQDALRHERPADGGDRKSTRLNSSHMSISYAVFCLKKKKKKKKQKKEQKKKNYK